MRTQAGAGVEQARIEEIGREELVFVALDGSPASVETGLGQSGEDALAIGAALVPGLVAAVPAGIATLKSMSSEKRLIRPQPFDSDVPPPKAGTRCAVIEAGEHADRARDVPILLDQSRVRRSRAATSFNEAPVQHVRNSEEHRCTDRAANPPADADDAARRHLGRFACVVILFHARRRGLDAETAESFAASSRSPLVGVGCPSIDDGRARV